jgi:hypothetical protein
LTFVEFTLVEDMLIVVVVKIAVELVSLLGVVTLLANKLFIRDVDVPPDVAKDALVVVIGLCDGNAD